jgi:predicted nucleic acid-binding protein
MLIVADTSPLNYLVLVQADSALPKLYQRVLIPPEVLKELRQEGAPPEVKAWADSPPNWLEVRAPTSIDPSLTALLDLGEASAISLAKEIHADRLLIDDRDGRQIARNLGLYVAGTLAVLRDAARGGLVDLRAVFERLKRTSFRADEELYAQLLKDIERC